MESADNTAQPSRRNTQRTAPLTATLVVDPTELDAERILAVSAWLGLSDAALQTLISEGHSIPLAPSGDPTTIRAEAERLTAAGLPVSVEVHRRPFARTASVSLRVGGLGVLLLAIARLTMVGLGEMIGTMSDPAVALLILVPGLLGLGLTLLALPTTLIAFVLGTLRRNNRIRELADTAQKVDSLKTPTLQGEPGRLQAHCTNLARRVVEAGMPSAITADLLSGLSACQAVLPELARSLSGIEQAMADAPTDALTAAHDRLTTTLRETAAQIALVEVGLAEMTVNNLEGRGATNESTLHTVTKSAQALTMLAKEMR